MNNTAAFKAITPLVNSYVQRESSAEAIMGLIAAILTENRSVRPASNGRELKKDHGGYRVTDRNGGVYKYPTAVDTEITEDGRLMVLGEGLDVLAIYNRIMWASAEKIA